MTRSPDAGAANAGTIRLGELSVNRMGFGAMRLCGSEAWGRRRDRGNAHRVLRRALELGVTFIDTADSYGPEVDETLIAESLYPYPQGLVVATKGGLVRPDRWSWVEDGRPAWRQSRPARTQAQARRRAPRRRAGASGSCVAACPLAHAAANSGYPIHRSPRRKRARGRADAYTGRLRRFGMSRVGGGWTSTGTRIGNSTAPGYIVLHGSGRIA